MPIEVFVHSLVLVSVDGVSERIVDLPWLVVRRVEDGRSGSELNIGRVIQSDGKLIRDSFYSSMRKGEMQTMLILIAKHFSPRALKAALRSRQPFAN